MGREKDQALDYIINKAFVKINTQPFLYIPDVYKKIELCDKYRSKMEKKEQFVVQKDPLEGLMDNEDIKLMRF